MPHRWFSFVAAAAFAATGLAQQPVAAPQPAPPEQQAPRPHAVEQMRQEAAWLLPLSSCDATRRFLIATSFLPVVDTRAVYLDRATRRALSESQWASLDDEAKKPFERREFDNHFFYYTRYGTPLAYARPLDLLCQRLPDHSFAKKKVLDFGYGAIGHLRLLASIGADAHGIETDPILHALYSDPGDTGPVDAAPIAADIYAGRLTLHDGRWPADEKIAKEVGGGYDLFISKNTLKHGYIHPEKEVDKRTLIDLGVGDEAFVQTLYKSMNPGGLVLIYNICPAQKDPYIPWADGKCPFPRELIEKAGFEVLEFDRDDTDAARKMGEALHWHEGPDAMDINNDLFAWYTLLRRPAPAPSGKPAGSPPVTPK